VFLAAYWNERPAPASRCCPDRSGRRRRPLLAMKYPTPTNSLTLGFDIRQPLGNCDVSQWTRERREQFLIRPEILCPLSVDSSVWPRAWETSNEGPMHLWGSVSQILTTFPAEISSEPSSPIVIEIAVIAAEHMYRHWKNILEGTLHPELDRALGITLQDYGYDVADQFLLSGLSNCMLKPEELEKLRKPWKTSINSYGLFAGSEDAVRYSSICDSLIPEHAPFCAYRIRAVGFGRP